MNNYQIRMVVIALENWVAKKTFLANRPALFEKFQGNCCSPPISMTRAIGLGAFSINRFEH